MIDLLPLQTNLIPYWFFPWNTPTWPGFTPFIFHKELLAIDALRQIFIWKEFAFSQFKLGEFPLWNPYSFSGQPLIANFQSSVFYPLSWAFIFLSSKLAWSFYIFSQPILLFVFMVFWLRKKVGFLVSIFAAISLITSSFFATRYFWGVYIHSLLWIPLGLGLIDRFAEGKMTRLFFVASLSLVIALSILGGYPQFGLFSILLFGAYLWFVQKGNRFLVFGVCLILATLISAVQLLPTAELYRHSLRESSASTLNFNNSLLSPKYLATIFYPDIYGSPAVNDYLGGKDYSGVNGYFGIVPLVLAIGAVFFLRKRREVKFWIVVGLIGLIFAYDNPISHLPQLLSIPILNSSNAWNNLFFFQFSGIILAAIFLSKLPRKITLVVFFLAAITGSYYLLKVSPFGPIKYFYPSHPMLTWLSKNGGVNRFFGYRSSHFLSNLSTYYRIYSPEGYDSLWPSWYGQLISSADNGNIPSEVNRADVFVTETDTSYRRKLLNLLGVKFFLDKSDKPGGDSGPNLAKYSSDQFVLRGQWGEVSVYENKKALPRTFLTDQFIYSPKKEIISKIYSSKNPYIVILDETSRLPELKFTPGLAKIASYKANEVVVNTIAPGYSLLFLSDTYFPGWQAFINQQELQIYPANYAFRAVLVPPGKNEVRFVYRPKSFFVGAVLSLMGLGVLIWILLKSKLSKTG